MMNSTINTHTIINQQAASAAACKSGPAAAESYHYQLQQQEAETHKEQEPSPYDVHPSKDPYNDGAYLGPSSYYNYQ